MVLREHVNHVCPQPDFGTGKILHALCRSVVDTSRGRLLWLHIESSIYPTINVLWHQDNGTKW